MALSNHLFAEKMNDILKGLSELFFDVHILSHQKNKLILFFYLLLSEFNFWMSSNRKKKKSKKFYVQKILLQQDVMAEMESLKEEIAGHFEKLKAKIIDNEAP